MSLRQSDLEAGKHAWVGPENHAWKPCKIVVDTGSEEHMLKGFLRQEAHGAVV